MKDFAEFLGWVTVVCFVIGILNYVVKVINKRYLKDIPDKLKKIYKFIMRNIVKYHKLVGIIVGIILIAHFIILFNLKGIRYIGMAAMITMIVTIFLGVYGAYIKKKPTGSWKTLHKIFTVITLILVGLHVLTKL